MKLFRIQWLRLCQATDSTSTRHTKSVLPYVCYQLRVATLRVVIFHFTMGISCYRLCNVRWPHVLYLVSHVRLCSVRWSHVLYLVFQVRLCNVRWSHISYLVFHVRRCNVRWSHVLYLIFHVRRCNVRWTRDLYLVSDVGSACSFRLKAFCVVVHLAWYICSVAIWAQTLPWRAQGFFSCC